MNYNYLISKLKIDIRKLDVKKEQTSNKIKYITSYVKNWLVVVTNRPTIKYINFIDCMCNAGMYTDGDLTTALEVLIQFAVFALMKRDKEFHIFLNDNSTARVDICKKICEYQQSSMNIPDNVIIHYSCQDVNSYIEDYTIFDKYLIRSWDFANTLPSEKNANPDWTVGVLMGAKISQSKDDPYEVAVLDVARDRRRFEGVKQFVLDVASRDGKGVTISLPLDPGGASHFTRQLSASLTQAGYKVVLARPKGSKVDRFALFSQLSEAGYVYADTKESLGTNVTLLSCVGSTEQEMSRMIKWMPLRMPTYSLVAKSNSQLLYEAAVVLSSV